LLKRWFISAYAAVVRKDGDDFRNRGVLVLQGEQGIGKTTFLRTLCGAKWGGSSKWFGEGLTLDPEVKDSRISAISYWITELAELERTTKKNMAPLKAFLTNSTDSIRKPYAAEETKFTRRTVFAGTVNETGFLTDTTGNSRFWVIPVKELKDISHIDMQQFWAEVKELYDQNYQWWLKGEEERILDVENRDYEPENAIADFLEKGLDWDITQTCWTYKTLTETLIECGIREPKMMDCKMAARLIKRQLGDNLEMQKTREVRKYKLPPTRWEVKNHDGFMPSSEEGL